MESILSFSPTICKLMGVSPPSMSSLKLLDALPKAATAEAIRKVERCVIFTPDAIGMSLFNTYPGVFDPVLRYAPIQVPTRATNPPKTPVCYASMFTGALPDFHGVTSYRKDVLTCDTIFDAMIRADRRVAIVAVRDSTLDCMFRDREMDYFSEANDDDVTERTIGLITSGNYEFIVAYHQAYDDALHKTDPESSEAIEAMMGHISSFVEIAGAVDRNWEACNALVAFAPDHGAHVDPATGKGTHGDDIPEDMEVMHLYGISKRHRTLW
jgi:hypothetical protein